VRTENKALKQSIYSTYDPYKNQQSDQLSEVSPQRYKNSIGESNNVRALKQKVLRAKLYNSAEDQHLKEDDETFVVNPQRYILHK
jgi:hypothetical protein